MNSHGSERPVAFEVSRNGRRVCVAGLRGRRGVVSIIVHWVDRDDELMLQVGGLDSETRESLTWAVKPLAVGDELAIRVLKTAATTRVQQRQLQTKLFDVRLQKAQLRAMAKKQGYKLVKLARPAKSAKPQL